MDSLSDLRIVGRVCDLGFRRRLLQTRCRTLKVGEVWHFDAMDCLAGTSGGIRRAYEVGRKNL